MSLGVDICNSAPWHFSVFTLNFPEPMRHLRTGYPDQRILILIRNSILIYTELCTEVDVAPERPSVDKRCDNEDDKCCSPGYKENVVGNAVISMASQLVQGSTITPKV